MTPFDDDSEDGIHEEAPPLRRGTQTCSECGCGQGGHFAFCPEQGDEEEEDE